MPGIDVRAPERTETSNGRWASANVTPVVASSFARCSSTCSQSPSGH